MLAMLAGLSNGVDESGLFEIAEGFAAVVVSAIDAGKGLSSEEVLLRA